MKKQQRLCKGHSTDHLRIDITLCDSCAWANEYPEDTSHRWWHTLLPLDSRVLTDEPIGALSLPPPPSSFTPAQGTKKNTSVLVNGQSVLAKPPDTQLSVNANPLLPDTGGLLGVSESVQKLDSRMFGLEGKVDANQLAMEVRMSGLEKRMENVEGKLDAILGELKKGMEAILASRT